MLNHHLGLNWRSCLGSCWIVVGVWVRISEVVQDRAMSNHRRCLGLNWWSCSGSCSVKSTLMFRFELMELFGIIYRIIGGIWSQIDEVVRDCVMSNQHWCLGSNWWSCLGSCWVTRMKLFGPVITIIFYSLFTREATTTTLSMFFFMQRCPQSYKQTVLLSILALKACLLCPHCSYEEHLEELLLLQSNLILTYNAINGKVNATCDDFPYQDVHDHTNKLCCWSFSC